MVARFLVRIGSIRVALPALVAGAALIAAPGASAGPGFSTTTPYVFLEPNTCTGETMAGTGTFHFLVSDNLSSSGNVQSHIEATISGLQATGTVTGKKYVVVNQENLTNTFDSDDVMPFHFTWERTVQYVRSGEDGTLFLDDDFYEHFLMHATVNANGMVTVDEFTDDVHCK
jgi:hypothetical protein